MSENQPKLKFEEDKERTATRSPPKKSKVEQSVPKKNLIVSHKRAAAQSSSLCCAGRFDFSGLQAALVSSLGT